jgi:HAD superfamily phosphatase (TIGR01668 family)
MANERPRKKPAVSWNVFAPHLRVDSVLELTLPRLRELGLETLLLDVDCTLKRYRATEVEPAIRAWLDELRTAGLRVCLVSNGRARRIGRLAASLDLPFVAKAYKPLPFRCKAALAQLGMAGRPAAMVGDQVFADILAGRLAGLLTILVAPIHPEDEPCWTRIKRPFERWLLRRLERP